jgi:hypothetical protein
VFILVLIASVTALSFGLIAMLRARAGTAAVVKA